MDAPENPAAAKLVVCERTGRWATALRRELAASGVRVWETRSLADCRLELLEHTASFIVVELEKDIGGMLRFLAAERRRFPAARLAVAADRSLVECEAALREAGAVHFLCSPRGVGLLARLACRHLAQIPPPPQTLTERIWASLPWGERRITSRSSSSPLE
jgi:hypothetical protein